MKRFIIIGLGNFGATVAEALYAQGHEVVAVDPDEGKVDRIARHVTRAAVGDGRDPHVLEQVGAKGADGGVVSTGDDITASILSSLALRDLGVDDVYVKVISREHARVMERIGVTETVFPERESALALGTRMSGSGLLNYVRLGAGVSIQEMAVPGEWTNRTLRGLELRNRYGISVVAVHDILTDRVTVAPDPDEVLKESDTLFVAGREEDLAKVAAVK
jgi:trk system potassium uptake protein TrkA